MKVFITSERVWNRLQPLSRPEASQSKILIRLKFGCAPTNVIIIKTLKNFNVDVAIKFGLDKFAKT